jgi:ketosteroid isomerase-like protein
MSDAALTETDIAAIRAVSEVFSEHMKARDFASLGKLYTEDAVLMPGGAPAVSGRAAIGEFMAGFPPLSRVELAVEEIDGRGDLAFVRGSFAMTMEPEGAPAPVEMVGKYIEIRARQDDGSWLISRDIFNSDES